MSYTQRILRAMLAGLIIFVVPIASNSGTWPDPSNYISTGPAEILLEETYDYSIYTPDGSIYDTIYTDITGYMSIKSSRAALKKLIAKAQSGNAEAQALLANLYASSGLNGVISHNNRKAAQWMHKAVQGMRKAAERGDSNAQYILGVYYESGQGVPGSYAEAAKWYRKAAQQGHSRASFRLGLLYDNGNGVAQDDALAAYWYRKALQERKAGQFDDWWPEHNLGTHYEDGSGVPKNIVLALALYLAPECYNISPGTDGVRPSEPFASLKEMTSRQIEDAQFLCNTMKKDGTFDVMERYLAAVQNSPDSKKSNTSSHSPD